MEPKTITKEQFIISRLSDKIGQLETFIAELQYQNILLMQEIKTSEKEESENGEEEKQARNA